ncbi:MAG: phospho-sugar mutase [Corallococcus sp.]|nr:phospho-sugar mutase [Corallococcus sp.]
MDYLKNYEIWQKRAKDKDIIRQLALMQDDENAKKNAFYKDLEFGTAGLRGTMGAGTNCLNVYTIIKTTQGIADYMKTKGFNVACVTYDSRLNSELFSQTVAQVFASNNIKCHITKGCKPTPFLSYMTRELNCDIGVNVTASHNPKEYNGYKVYGFDGCQITDAAAEEITEYIERVDPFEVKVVSLDDAAASGYVQYVTVDLEERYLSEVEKQSLSRADGIKVAYTPLNGAGYEFVPALLQRRGAQVHTVAEQGFADGNFTTCPYPNPEFPETLTLARKLAEEKNCDIVIGTDPDSDRIGVSVKSEGKFVQLTGNEVGILLCDYILSSLKAQQKLPEHPVIVKTIVTTGLIDRLAADYGAEVVDVLTGFKYIGTVIGKLEQSGERDRYVFGFEESCGYLKGTYVRDKDAVVASMLVAEMAASLKKQGLTLKDRLDALYKTYGKFLHKTFSYRFEGAEGAEEKRRFLENLRRNPVTEIAGSKVVFTRDYLTQTEVDLPKSDVMTFLAENGSKLIVRPSGTEPMVKNYVTVVGTEEENQRAIVNVKSQLDAMYGK